MNVNEILEATRKLGELEARVDALYCFLENQEFLTEEEICLIMGFDDLYKKIKEKKEELLKGCVANV